MDQFTRILLRLVPWLRGRQPVGSEYRSLRLVSHPPEVFDTATFRLGDGFISAEFPPMRR
jgi:hypothetical protein